MVPPVVSSLTSAQMSRNDFFTLGYMLTNQVGSSGGGNEAIDLTKMPAAKRLVYWVSGPGNNLGNPFQPLFRKLSSTTMWTGSRRSCFMGLAHSSISSAGLGAPEGDSFRAQKPVFLIAASLAGGGLNFASNRAKFVTYDGGVTAAGLKSVAPLLLIAR